MDKKLLLNIRKLSEVKPHEVLSIGDNFINEIAPALSLGTKAMYIQPHGHNEEVPNLQVIPSITACYQN